MKRRVAAERAGTGKQGLEMKLLKVTTKNVARKFRRVIRGGTGPTVPITNAVYSIFPHK